MQSTKENPVALAIETTKNARNGTVWAKVRRTRRWIAAMIGSLAFLIAGAGSASAQTTPTPEEETVTLVSGIAENVLNAVKSVFTDAILPSATILTLLFVGVGMVFAAVWALGRKGRQAVSG